MSRIAAVIVCFHPSGEQLSKLIMAVAGEVDEIIIFNNGGLDKAGLPAVACPLKVESRDGENLGIATALNLACEAAWRENCRYVVTFDQDSLPGEAMIATLLEEFEVWRSRGHRVAAIGPQLLDVRGEERRDHPFLMLSRFGARRTVTAGTGQVSQLITSGCLLDLQIWQQGARFDDGLFIDWVDINWCWRLILQGHELLGTTRATLVHELSSGLRETRWLTLTRYGPVRRYFQCRNAVYHLFWVSLPSGGYGFILKNIVSTMISAIRGDDHLWQSLWQCCRGLVHGVKKKMGPFHP